MSRLRNQIKYIAILFVALLTISGKSIAAEEWNCWKYSFDRSGPPLVRLHQSDNKSSGSVEVFGETHLAQVGIEGLTKRWSFGEDFDYAFVIRPDGFSNYYDFSIEDKAKPSMTFYCVLAQPSVEQHQSSKTKEKPKSQEAELKAKLLAEENQRRSTSLQEVYKMAIFQKVRRNWIPPVGSEKVSECWVRVLQGSGGIVLDVTFGTCNGSTATYRASIENAVYKAEPLPKPADPSLFERELNFNFRPE